MKPSEIPVVILAGGKGLRISEVSSELPKPMIPVGNRPIIWHIMRYFASFGFKKFIIASGHKGVEIKRYFYSDYLLDASIRIHNGRINQIREVDAEIQDWDISIINTGENTGTGGRVMDISSFISTDTFFLTYGDGLSNVPIDQLLDFHHAHGKLATVSAVKPLARFGEIRFNHGDFIDFIEKPLSTNDWINGGFMVFSSKVFEIIDSSHESLEFDFLPCLSNMNELIGFRHDGFWHCMDTRRDYEHLNKMWETGELELILTRKPNLELDEY